MSTQNHQPLYRGFLKNHLVEVIDLGEFRSLYFGHRSLQSRMSLSRPHELVLPYTFFMVLPLLFEFPLRNILIVGIGSGSFIRFFHHHFAECHIDAVDYSPEVIKIAKGYFQLPANGQISIHCMDGRYFLQQSRGMKYDLILIDAFDDQGMSASIYSDDFFYLCAETLAPTGAISCNLWSNDQKYLAEIKTILASYFTSCLYLPVPDRGNIIGMAMPFVTPWPLILKKKKQFNNFSQKYNLDFRRLARVAKQNNLSLPGRLVARFRQP